MNASGTTQAPLRKNLRQTFERLASSNSDAAARVLSLRPGPIPRTERRLPVAAAGANPIRAAGGTPLPGEVIARTCAGVAVDYQR
jgi:hypothetical protein